MYCVNTEEGHPFINGKWNDLMDYSLALAKGVYLDILTGRVSLSNGMLYVLDFRFWKCYVLENSNDDDELQEELDENVNHWNFDDDDDFDDDGRIHLSYDSCFAVIIIRFKKMNGQLHQCLTAIHKKYRQAITITKNLTERKQPFHISEVDYDKVDKSFKPILKEFDII